MDNKILNVNGRTKEQLKKALAFALLDEYGKTNIPKGYEYSRVYGLIVTWYVQDCLPFTNHLGTAQALDPDELLEVLWGWLQTTEAKEVECTDWDADSAHDGSNEPGWRLYCEDWGTVGGNRYAIFAFKPCFLWYGK